ncbi:MAG TPA: hypothetical protein VII06_29600 [Chloroflexota bacterium]|jgi:hypothetical protein
MAALPPDVIGAALDVEGRAAVSVYAGLGADAALPDRISLADLKAGRLRWVCAARAELLPICS